MSRRRIITSMAALPLLALNPLRAADAPGRRRLGILAHGSREPTLAYFASSTKPALADLGWIEGKTLEMIWRFGEGDESRFPALAKDLVVARPDVIGTASTSRTRALQQATRTIPIVTEVGDPVKAGFAQSLARPGGNITGFSLGDAEITRKRLELLKATLPRLATLAILRAQTPAYGEVTEAVAAAAREAGLAAQAYPIASMADVDRALRAVPGGGRGAALPMALPHAIDGGAVMQLAIRLRVPAMSLNDEAVEAGGLFFYTLVHEDQERRTAVIFDKLFRGADPGLIPFELPQRTVFVINRRTAAAIGVAFPADFAIRATRVID